MSKTTDAIRYAKERDYTADREGNIYGPRGNRLKLRQQGNKNRTYPHFGVRLNGQTIGIAAHKFISFLKFGELAIADGIHTRHLNDDPQDNRWENIAIGSHSDNMMDKPEQLRKSAAQKAGRARSLPDDLWTQIELERNEGATYPQLSERYGIAKSTLSFRLSKNARKMVMR